MNFINGKRVTKHVYDITHKLFNKIFCKDIIDIIVDLIDSYINEFNLDEIIKAENSDKAKYYFLETTVNIVYKIDVSNLRIGDFIITPLAWDEEDYRYSAISYYTGEKILPATTNSGNLYIDYDFINEFIPFPISYEYRGLIPIMKFNYTKFIENYEHKIIMQGKDQHLIFWINYKKYCICMPDIKDIVEFDKLVLREDGDCRIDKDVTCMYVYEDCYA